MKKNLICMTGSSFLVLFGFCFVVAASAWAEENASENAQNETKAEQTQKDEARHEVAAEQQSENQVDEEKKPLVIDGLVLTDAERRVFELTNSEREKRGLPALKLDRRLMESARRQANWMARTGIFRHGNSGYAENIAMGQRSSKEVVVAWMNSSGHFRNMMNRSTT